LRSVLAAGESARSLSFEPYAATARSLVDPRRSTASAAAGTGSVAWIAVPSVPRVTGGAARRVVRAASAASEARASRAADAADAATSTAVVSLVSSGLPSVSGERAVEDRGRIATIVRHDEGNHLARGHGHVVHIAERASSTA